jgi:hypothetical protein
MIHAVRNQLQALENTSRVSIITADRPTTTYHPEFDTKHEERNPFEAEAYLNNI